jgi:hypothetical protein
MRQTSDLVANARPSAVLTLGDTQYEDGSLASFQASYNPTWGRFKSITRPVIGNHEYGTPDAAGYFDYFNGPGRKTGRAGDRDKGYYSFDLGQWHLVALNANCQLPQVACSTRSRQARWLRADLDRTSKKCVLAYAGRPRFSSDETGKYQPLGDFYRILYNRHADVLISGDSHNYERFAPQDPNGRVDRRGIRQFVAGTGGKNISKFETVHPNSEARATVFGVLFLRLHERSYEWQFLGEPGSGYVDSGRRYCR